MRGREAFVEVPWDQALDLAAQQLQRVIREHGNTAIFGGSYGWASAGRFHHAQSQLHRFLNLLGGCTRAMNSYSTAAAQVILPHVIAPWHLMELQQTRWRDIVSSTELLVSFGGLPLRNAQVAYGGITEHFTANAMRDAHQRGVEFVTIGPIRDDGPEHLSHQWQPLRPGTDVAFMLGLAHTLVIEDLANRDFLATHSTGFDRFEDYLLGTHDGTAKDAAWAAAICGVDAEPIKTLARKMASRRTFVNAAWSLQRAHHGEQPYWMLVTLAAMLGQMGLTGGGVGFGYSAEGFVGSDWRRFNWATFPKGRNPTGLAIPVARISDMLLNPGKSVDYDGNRIEYPDTQLIYWAGGNPFHHHQDLSRLRTAWQKPATVIVNEPWWTPVARHADIIFPATTALEREDLSASSHDPYAHVMQQALTPQAEARSDHEIFAGLAARLDIKAAFTENRTPREWLRNMWQRSEEIARREGFELPSFDAFWQEGQYKLPDPAASEDWLAGFRADPTAHPLPTPSGKIEIYSEKIAGFGYADCPPHATWLEPFERLGGKGSDTYPLHLVSNQPRKRLHSQLDHSKHSHSGKVNGRERVRMHPDAATARGINNGDTVRIFNARGQCLAGAHLDEHLMLDVIELPTGAWFDPFELPDGSSLELAGNPNVLTHDVGTSSLAQGPSAHTCLVEVERYDKEAPAPRVYRPPQFTTR
jgi:biotin/methionine sulfoxide reductase